MHKKIKELSKINYDLIHQNHEYDRKLTIAVEALEEIETRTQLLSDGTAKMCGDIATNALQKIKDDE